MKKKYGVMGIIALVILVVTTCGCTSSDASTITPQKDIFVSGGEINPEPNGPANEWFFNGNLESRNNIEYLDVIVQFNGYNSQGKLVGTKKMTVPWSNGQGYFEVVMVAHGDVSTVNMTVINATKSS